jgi:hypothetical protein
MVAAQQVDAVWVVGFHD